MEGKKLHILKGGANYKRYSSSVHLSQQHNNNGFSTKSPYASADKLHGHARVITSTSTKYHAPCYWRRHIIVRFLQDQHSFFFEHFDRLVADKRYEEVRCDFKATQSTPSLKSDLAASYAAERRGHRSLPAPCPAVVTLTRRN